MYNTIKIAHLSKTEWLQKRKQGIGGSDAGAICGLNPYISPINVYQNKISTRIEDLDNEAMRQGRELEEYVAKRFTEATGLKVRRSNVMYQNKEYPFMLADVDRMVVGEDAGLECKTANAFQTDKWKDGKIPAHYLLQCLHYMAVTGKTSWYLAVVILGKEFHYVKIDRDEAMIENLVAIEKEFWERHVVPRVMPEPDGSPACDEVIQSCFPVAEKKEIFLPSEFDAVLQRREEILQLSEKLEIERKNIEQRIKLFMGENEIATNEHYQVSWANVDSARIDTRRMKQEQPELYRQFSKVSHSRRFVVKAA